MRPGSRSSSPCKGELSYQLPSFALVLALEAVAQAATGSFTDPHRSTLPGSDSPSQTRCCGFRSGRWGRCQAPCVLNDEE